MSNPNPSPATKDLPLFQIAKAARIAELRTGFPALITISQWAIESAWGAKPTPGYNYFGIKYASRHYSFRWAPTTEYYNSLKDLDYALQSLTIKDYSIVSKPNHLPIKVNCQAKFAFYSSPQSSIDDYIYLMTLPEGLYYKAFQIYRSSPKTPKDLNTLGLSIASIYATSPSYGKLLTTLMSQSNIQSAINLAKFAATSPMASASPQPHSEISTALSAQEALTKDLLSLPIIKVEPDSYTEPTITLTAFLDTLGSSYLFFREPYFYICDKLSDGSLSLPKPISASALGFQPTVDTQTGKLIWANRLPNGPENNSELPPTTPHSPK